MLIELKLSSRLRSGWKMLHSRLRVALLIVGLTSGGATALATSPVATATNSAYSCSSCSAINGEDNWILDTEGDDYSAPDVAVTLWKKEGGGYKEFRTVLGEYHSEVCYSVESKNEIVGHGETHTHGGENAHLSGRETNYQNCEY